MNLKELDYMLAIAKYQNITKAAESLYITQPALTRFLQNIEKEFQQKFFKKLPPAYFTGQGRYLPVFAGACPPLPRLRPTPKRIWAARKY